MMTWVKQSEPFNGYFRALLEVILAPWQPEYSLSPSGSEVSRHWLSSAVLANKRFTVHQDNIYNRSKQQGYGTELHPNDSRMGKKDFKSTS